MRYLWLAIIALSLVPVAFVGFLLNPITLWVLGPEVWKERLTRLHPYRWWFAASLAVLAVAMFAYGLTYGW